MPLFKSPPTTSAPPPAHVPLAMEKFVMAFAGRDKLRIDVELVAFDADLAGDHRATARMVGQAEGDAGFARHRNSFLVHIVPTVPVVPMVSRHLEPLKP